MNVLIMSTRSLGCRRARVRIVLVSRRAFIASCIRRVRSSGRSTSCTGWRPGSAAGGAVASTLGGAATCGLGLDGCLGGGMTTGRGSSGGGAVVSAPSGTGWGAGSCAFVCGIESGGGGAGAVAAAGVGAGAAACTFLVLPVREHPASGTVSRIARVVVVRCISKPCSNRDRQANEERGPLPGFAGEIDCTIVKLHDPKRHREANPRPLFACCKVQAEDFVAEIGRNTIAGVGDADLYRFLVHTRQKLQ